MSDDIKSNVEAVYRALQESLSTAQNDALLDEVRADMSRVRDEMAASSIRFEELRRSRLGEISAALDTARTALLCPDNNPPKPEQLATAISSLVDSIESLSKWNLGSE